MKMTNKQKIYNIVSICLNIIITALVIYSIIKTYVTILPETDTILGTKSFRYFTIDSNILVAISSILMIISILFKKQNIVIDVINYVSTCQITLTLITVLIFLGPTMGYKPLLANEQLLLHLIVPLLKIINCLIFENHKNIKIKHTIYSFIPYLIYASFYIINVLIIKSWEDFYGFTKYLGTAFNIMFMTLLIGIITYVLYFAITKIYKSTSNDIKED